MIPFANSLKLVSGVDSKGCPQVLRPKPNSFLFSTDGGVLASWYDGSKAFPIVTPDFLQSEEAASSIVVQDEAGRWYRMAPIDPGGAKKHLVQEAGAIFFEEINKNQLCFPTDEISDIGKCDSFFAVWSQCDEGAGIMCLKKATKDELFPDDEGECEEIDINGYDGIMVKKIIDGKLVTKCIKPECGKVMVACCKEGESPVWKIRDGGLTFHPIEIAVVKTVTAAGSFPVILPGFPTDACGRVFAVFKSTVLTSEGPSGALTSFFGTIGDPTITVFTAGLGNVVSGPHETMVEVNTANQTLIVTKSGTGDVSATVRIIGYFYL